MTTGILADDIVINGIVYADFKNITLSELNNRLSTHATGPSRSVYQAQWCLHYAGSYTGPINGIVGPTSDLYNAFVATYNQAYSGTTYVAPSGGQISFALFRDIFIDYSALDTSVYHVVP